MHCGMGETRRYVRRNRIRIPVAELAVGPAVSGDPAPSVCQAVLLRRSALGGGSTSGTHADLPGYCPLTFTLIPVGYTPQPSVQVSGFDVIGRPTRLRHLVSASCSSDQGFAFGFLQIRSHG